ncbi:MAG: CoA-binding protein [Actinobacteria bacterium]|nr:CoA-binding protein [Actinomycetota bacterium]MBU1493393.1 CoA-binding protein [Actinomycetota bacterium]
MPHITELLQDPATSIAVIGANDNPSKYGGRVYRDLKAKGFRVFAVNANRDTVDGDPAFASLADLPEPPTIVNFVIPPSRTLRVLAKCKELGLMNAWIQPGAESDEVIDYLAAEGFNYLANACIMVQAPSLA